MLGQDIEIWKAVVGFPGYEVSNLGRARSFRPINGRGQLMNVGRTIKGRFTKRPGYWMLHLCRDGKTFDRLLHRVILEAFVGPCPDGMEACHWDDNRDNNHLTNLRWDTPKGNAADRRRNGLDVLGKSHNSKLSADLVVEIRSKRLSGHLAKDLAKEYGVAVVNISNCCQGATWAWLKTPSESTYLKFSGRKLGSYRLQANMSIKTLAIAAGVDYAYTFKLIQGKKSSPSWKVVSLFASALGIEPKDLCTETQVG